MENKNIDAEKNSVLKWIKAHKKELVVAGVSVATVAALIIGYKKRTDIFEMWNLLMCRVKKAPEHRTVNVPAQKEFNPYDASELLIDTPVNIENTQQVIANHVPQKVSSHIRNLHDGWQPSPEKMATASKYGYSLQPGQTWVDSYTKGGIAA